MVSESNCKTPKRLQTRWPLALDVILEVVRADKAGYILDYFMSIFERTGNTFEQQVLGGRSFTTHDPKNIEAVLSTQFNSK